MSDTTRIEKVQLLKEKLDRINSEIKRRCHPLSETPLPLDRHIPPDIRPGDFRDELGHHAEHKLEHLICPSPDYHAVLELKRKREACHEEIERLIDEGLSSGSTQVEPPEKTILPLSDNNPASQKRQTRTGKDWAWHRLLAVCKTIKDKSIKNGGEPGFTNEQISKHIVSTPEIYNPEFFKKLGWKGHLPRASTIERRLKGMGISKRGRPKTK
ncbi:MAG: hypothetical protein ABSF52_17385 [Syntrophobacteraceae bacterium]|jgi:hypothetical protein